MVNNQAVPWSAVLVAASFVSTVAAAEWPGDITKDFDPPPHDWLDRDSPVRSLTFESVPFEGHTTDVFAFYATPGSVSGDPTKDVDLPGVVLLHGGGGTAFAQWAEMWALRGYAAIAMDLSGRRPAPPTFDPKNRRVTTAYANAPTASKLERGGPNHTHVEKFANAGDDRSDDWQVHAVSAAVRAHSLLRSFDEVDADRTALTGISWGGYLTCLVASLDDRFQAAVPVYGCGFLYEGESVQKPSIDSLPDGQRELWIADYDPSAWLPRCRVPILFVNGTTDRHYPLDSYSRTVSLVAPSLRSVRIEPGMRHSHRHGWEEDEIGLFIDAYCKGGMPLPKLSGVAVDAGVARAEVESKRPIVSAALHYTTDDGLLRERTWRRIPAVIAHGEVTARVPNDATVWLMSVTDDRGAMVTTNAVVE